MWPNPQFPADLVTFTEEILNGKLHFLCNDFCLRKCQKWEVQKYIKRTIVYGRGSEIYTQEGKRDQPP